MSRLHDERPRASYARRIRRRGTTYVLVLLISTLVLVVGLGGFQTSRVLHRQAQVLSDHTSTRNLAVSAVDLGLRILNEETNWRTGRAEGIWISELACGDGTVSLEVSDPSGQAFLGQPTDPVQFAATGAHGMARFKLEVTVSLDGGSPAFVAGSWRQVVDP